MWLTKKYFVLQMVLIRFHEMRFTILILSTFLEVCFAEYTTPYAVRKWGNINDESDLKCETKLFTRHSTDVDLILNETFTFPEVICLVFVFKKFKQE